MDDPARSERYMTLSDQAAALTRAELAILRSSGAFARWIVLLHRAVSGTVILPFFVGRRSSTNRPWPAAVSV